MKVKVKVKVKMKIKIKIYWKLNIKVKMEIIVMTLDIIFLVGWIILSIDRWGSIAPPNSGPHRGIS